MAKYKMPNYKQGNLFNFHVIENIAKNKPKIFLLMLKDCFSTEGLIASIRMLKMSGICVDIYAGNSDVKLYKQSIKLLIKLNRSKSIDILRFGTEVDIFNKLFKDFKYLRDSTGVNHIRKQERVSSFLLGSEVVLSSMLDQVRGVSHDAINKKYPIFFTDQIEEEKFIKQFSNPERLNFIFESIGKYIAPIIKYFHFLKLPFSGERRTISLVSLERSSEHIFLFDRWNKLIELYEDWKFIDCELKEVSKNNFVFIPPAKEDYLKDLISVGRFDNLRFQRLFFLMGLDFSSKIVANTLKFYPEECRSRQELVSSILCMDFLGSEDLNEKVLDVPLKEWIRAYTLLSEIAEDFLKRRSLKVQLSLINGCILKTKDEWKKEFLKGGIDPGHVDTIINNLTFGRNSVDFFDCPLLPFGNNKFFSLASLSCTIDPAQALLSNFVNKQLDVNFRGANFEKSALNSVKKAGLVCSDLYSKQNNEEYQCDLVFLIEDEIYFIECKSFIQPNSHREYYDFITKLYEASKQLERINNYFINNMQIVNSRLNIPTEWRPRKVNKIILTKAMLGVCTNLNNCSVIDESAFVRFLQRDPPGIVFEKVVFKNNDPIFTGLITSDKLSRHINDTFQIRWVRDNYEEKEDYLILGKSRLKFIKYIKKRPSFRFV